MKHLGAKATIALALGLSLALFLSWGLSKAALPAIHTTAFTPDAAEQAQRPLLQAGNVFLWTRATAPSWMC